MSGPMPSLSLAHPGRGIYMTSEANRLIDDRLAREVSASFRKIGPLDPCFARLAWLLDSPAMLRQKGVKSNDDHTARLEWREPTQIAKVFDRRQ